MVARDLTRPDGYQGALLGPNPLDPLKHFGMVLTLNVELNPWVMFREVAGNDGKVVVADMTLVSAGVNGDAVGASTQYGIDDVAQVGNATSSAVPKKGVLVDVDGELCGIHARDLPPRRRGTEVGSLPLRVGPVPLGQNRNVRNHFGYRNENRAVHGPC